MEKRKKAAFATLPQNNSKSTNSCKPKQEVRRLFLTGEKFTAMQLNKLANFNDARKIISTLRADGMNIKDRRLSDGKKLYWLVEDEIQLELSFNNCTEKREERPLFSNDPIHGLHPIGTIIKGILENSNQDVKE